MLARLALLTGFTAAGLAHASAFDAESAFRGRKLAEANCEVCHAIALTDASVEDKAPPFRELWKRPAFAELRQQLRGPLFARHPEMPDFQPTAEQADDLATYIESIQVRSKEDQTDE